MCESKQFNKFNEIKRSYGDENSIENSDEVMQEFPPMEGLIRREILY
jgi:hypothetical protein